MKNNLNKKNKSISKTDELYNLFNDNNINIIPSRDLNLNNKKSKKNIKSINSKKSSKKIIQKREISDTLNQITQTNYTIQSNNIKQSKNIIPQGENYKCIGPCYPANMVYYHPLSLQVIKNKYSSCPIKSVMVDDTRKIYDKCKVDENFDYENYDIFTDIFHLASTDNLFLEQIYNIYNITDAILFLENNINELPILSQKRIINSLYKVYRDNDIFPNDKFIEIVKKLLKYNYNIEVKTNKILNKIMKNKHKQIWDDLFEKIIE